MSNTDTDPDQVDVEGDRTPRVGELPSPYDWAVAESPAFRRRAHCKIAINGFDVTNNLDPYLISLKVVMRIGAAPGGQVEIELDDRDGKLPIPPSGSGSIIAVRLGWEGSGPRPPLHQHIGKLYDQVLPEMTAERQQAIAQNTQELPWEGGTKLVFQGFVDEVESGFNRKAGGRRLWIIGKSANNYGLAKEPQSFSLGEGGSDAQHNIVDFLGQAAARAGLSFKASSAFTALKRSFWHQDNESFQQLGQRLADEVGGEFVIEGNTAYLLHHNRPGRGTIEAIWGINLISWRIKPYSGRPQWAGSNQRFFNAYMGMWRQMNSAIGGSVPFGGASAIAGLPNAAPNAVVGGQRNEGTSPLVEAKRGTGWVILNGEPSAMPDSSCLIKGARPGVDGLYRVREVEHNYTRSGGFTTRCELVKPRTGDPEDWKQWGWVNPDVTTQNGVPVPAQPPVPDGVFETPDNPDLVTPNIPPGTVPGTGGDGASGGGGGGGGGGGF